MHIHRNVLRIGYFIFGLVLVIILVWRLYHTIQTSDSNNALLGSFVDTTVFFEGRVHRVTDFEYKTSLRLVEATINDVPIGNRRVYVDLTDNNEIVPGEYVRGQGVMELRQSQAGEYMVIKSAAHLEEMFDFKSAVIKRFLWLQMQITQQLRLLFPEPHAAIVGGIVFGIEGQLSKDYYETFRRTGVLHVLVASGFNAVLVVEFVRIIGRAVIPKYELLLITVGVLAYTGIAGFQIPIIRASLMAGGRLWTQRRGDIAEGLIFLIATAYVLLLIQPMWLFSVSFQLSFMASLGLIFFASIEHKLPFGKGMFAELALTTVFAQLFTAPVIYLHFHEVTWLGLISNPLVLWTVPLIMFGGTVAFVLSFVHISIGTLAALPVFLVLEYFIFVIGGLSV